MSKHEKEAKFKTNMELSKAVAYLDDVVASLRAGTVSISNGAHALTLKPESTVKVELEAEQKEDRETLSMRVSWRKAQDGAHPELRISPKAPESAKAAAADRK